MKLKKPAEKGRFRNWLYNRVANQSYATKSPVGSSPPDLSCYFLMSYFKITISILN